MSKIGIYYGSTTGNTQDVAEEIAKKLNIPTEDIHDVAKADTNFSSYDIILFGSSTMGFGDLQDDWEYYIEKVGKADLEKKTVALFGCGDSSSYSDTFGDAIGKIYQTIKDKGCKIIGEVETEGYTFEESEAVIDNKFVGLLVDNDNEANMTDERISKWIEKLKKEI